MVITIKDKEYDLHFGFKFIEQANAERGLVVGAGDEGSMSINTQTQGVQMLTTGLDSYDPVAVRDVIRFGTNTERSKPKVADIEKFVEDLATEGDPYFEFVDELSEEIKKQPLLNIRRGS